MTKQTDDVLIRFVSALRNAGATFTDDIALTAESHLRQELGGSRHYIQKAPKLGKAHALGTAIRSGANIKEAMNKVGCSRRNGFRLLAVKLR